MKHRPILLVEDPNAVYGVSDFTAFTEAGFGVLQCDGGPDCPLLAGERCELVDAADVVLFASDRSEERRRLLDRLIDTGTPILMYTTDDVPAECTPLPWPISVNGQVQAVRRAATA